MSWNAYLTTPSIKYRPIDSPPADTILYRKVVRGQWASFQVACVVDGEDVAGVNVTCTTPTMDINTFETPIIYKEETYNVIIKSRDDGATGEWPDALIPKVDQFYSEARNAFPFSVGRVSPAYAMFDFNIASSNPVTRTNGATTKPTISGSFSGESLTNYHLKITLAGARGAAQFKWSDDGGATWDATGITTSSDGNALNNGLTVLFANVDYTLDDEWEFFADTHRTQMVWIESYIPTTAPIGLYESTVTVSATGKDDQVLTVYFTVYDLTIPKTSTIPIYYTGGRDSVSEGHYADFQSPSHNPIYQDYLEACLNHRISINKLEPGLTWNGSSITNWSTYETWIAPYLDGSWSMGSKLSIANVPVATATPTHDYHYYLTVKGSLINASDLTADEINYLTALKTETDANGWTSKYYTIICEEPGTITEAKTTAINEVGPDIQGVGFKTIGTNAYVADWGTSINAYVPWLGNVGANPTHGEWGYLSCMSHGCNATGGSNLNKWPSHAVDSTLPNLRGYYWLIFDNDVKGDLYYQITDGYKFYLSSFTRRHDPWDSMYDFGADGDGTVFYPGRPDKIGGTNHIPIETLRLKAIRMGLEDYEIFKLLTTAGYGSYVTSQLQGAVGNDKYFYAVPPSGSDMDSSMDNILSNLLAGQALTGDYTRKISINKALEGDT